MRYRASTFVCGAACACSVSGGRGRVPLSRRLAWGLDSCLIYSKTGYLLVRLSPPGRAPQSLVVQGWACDILLSVFGVVAVSLVKLDEMYHVLQVVLPLDGHVLLLVVSLIECFVEDGVLPVMASEEGNGLIGFLQVFFCLFAPLAVMFSWCSLYPLFASLLPDLSWLWCCPGTLKSTPVTQSWPPVVPLCDVWPVCCGCRGCWRQALALWFTTPPGPASQMFPPTPWCLGGFPVPRLSLWALFLAPHFFWGFLGWCVRLCWLSWCLPVWCVPTPAIWAGSVIESQFPVCLFIYGFNPHAHFLDLLLDFSSHDQFKASH